MEGGRARDHVDTRTYAHVYIYLLPLHIRVQAEAWDSRASRSTKYVTCFTVPLQSHALAESAPSLEKQLDLL